jgi:RNA polymerase sigma-70 factor (ECF subfamily)
LKKRKRESTITFDENYLLKNELKDEELLPVIFNLPLEYRNVIYLYYYEGYSTKEISSILKRRDATIRTWLKRARERIGGYLNE